MTFIDILSPADLKGTRLLSQRTTGGSQEQRLYLPALKKVRRISGAGKKGKFIGSDIFYYDLEKRDFGDSVYTFLREEEFNSIPCSVIEMKPRAADSPYGKTEAWVSKRDHFIYKMVLYNKSGVKWKTMVVLTAELSSGIIVPLRTVMDNHKENRKTLLRVTSYELNPGLKDQVFTVQNLQR